MRVKRAVLSGVAYKHDDREHALVWKPKSLSILAMAAQSQSPKYPI